MKKFAIVKRIPGSVKIAMGFIVLLFLGAVFAPALSSYPPDGIDLDSSRLAPSAAHWFGTDTEGRDVFVRVLYGARVSLLVGFGATVLAMLIGLVAGLVAGYWGGSWIDKTICALTDIGLAFPSLLLAIAVSIVLDPGLVSVFVALALAGWGTFARLIRGVVLSLRASTYVTASVATGTPQWLIILKHILPGCLPSLIVAGVLKAGTFILGEAGLSFLGIGVPPPAPSWGAMVSTGRSFLLEAPWMSFFPGLMIALVVLAVNVCGDWLKERISISGTMGRDRRNDF